MLSAKQHDGQLIMRLPNVGWILDRTQSDMYPRFVQTEGPDMTDPNNYRPAANGLNNRDDGSFHRIVGSRLWAWFEPFARQVWEFA